VDETTPFCSKYVVSFKRKWHQDFVNLQISPQFVICSIKSSIAILIFLKSIQLHPYQIQSQALKLATFFTLVLGFEFVQFDPQLIHKLLISSI
jgi:hypothetical protein